MHVLLAEGLPHECQLVNVWPLTHNSISYQHGCPRPTHARLWGTLRFSQVSPDRARPHIVFFFDCVVIFWLIPHMLDYWIIIIVIIFFNGFLVEDYYDMINYNNWFATTICGKYYIHNDYYMWYHIPFYHSVIWRLFLYLFYGNLKPST